MLTSYLTEQLAKPGHLTSTGLIQIFFALLVHFLFVV